MPGHSFCLPPDYSTQGPWNYPNPNDKHPLITLAVPTKVTKSGGNNTYQVVRSYAGKFAGRWYFEVRANTTTTNATVALLRKWEPLTVQPGGVTFANSVGLNMSNGQVTVNGSVVTTIGGWSYSAGDWLGIAVVLDNTGGKLFVRNGATWLNASDPVNLTNPIISNITTYPLPQRNQGCLYPAFGIYSTSTEIEVNFGATAFNQTIPATYSPWDRTYYDENPKLMPGNNSAFETRRGCSDSHFSFQNGNTSMFISVANGANPLNQYVPCGGVMPWNSGKYYWEHDADIGGAHFSQWTGVANLEINLSAQPPGTAAPLQGSGFNIMSSFFKSGSLGNTISTPGQTDIAHGNDFTSITRTMTCFDTDTGKLWFGVNNSWLNSGNPSTGANPITILPPDNYSAWFLNAAFGDPTGPRTNIWMVSSLWTYAAPTNAKQVPNTYYLGGHPTLVRYGAWSGNDRDGNVAIDPTLPFTKASVVNDENAWRGGRGNFFRYTGKWYFEVKVNAVGAGVAIGIANASATLSNFIGFDANGWAYHSTANKYNNNSATGFGATFTDNDTIMVAVDLDAQKVWFGKNGTWQGSGVPNTGTNPAYSNLPTSGLTSLIYPAWSGVDNGTDPAVTINTGATAFTYTVPSGFNSGWYEDFL